MEPYIGLFMIGVLSRLVPHPANFTAVTAVSIFAGSRCGWVRTGVLVFFVMVFSDLILGFHSVMWATYGSYLLIVGLSSVTLRSVGAGKIIGTTVSASVLFYLITNFAVWQEGILYPVTLTGLIDSYIAGLPFLRNSLFGDLTYSMLFFGMFRLSSVWHHVSRVVCIFKNSVLWGVDTLWKK